MPVMKIEVMTYELVEFIPETLSEGILYVSEKYKTAAHKCCCGCGEEVITPLNPTDWKLQIQDGKVSMWPSIGNWSYACNSHYIIRHGRILWVGEMSQEAIQMGRDADKIRKDKYFDSINKQKDMNTSPSVSDWLNNIIRKVMNWLGL